MSSSYRQELDKWLRSHDVKAHKLLDIGGSQLPLKGRTATFDVDFYQIADLPHPHVDSPKPGIILDLNFPTLTEDDKEKYDAIYCLEVFDYIWNPVDAMKTIHDLLAPGGIAWITFPTVYPHHQPVEDDALRYMRGGIEKLCKFTGLQIIEMIPRRPETDAVEQLWRRERMRAAKHFDHNVTGWIVEVQK